MSDSATFPTVQGLRVLELGTPGPMRDRLNYLVLAGWKRATAGTISDDDVEKVGERLALVSSTFEKVAEVEVVSTTVSMFADVPWAFALAEGEGDESIEQWRAGHRSFWEAAGVRVSDDMPVRLTYFRLVDPAPVVDNLP